MRYLVILQALGYAWEGVMRARGVEESTVESWAVYWNQLTRKAGMCRMEELNNVGYNMASCFRTALWYIEKASKS
jgi:uncharacterized protein (DUF885 family)